MNKYTLLTIFVLFFLIGKMKTDFFTNKNYVYKNIDAQ